MYELILYWDLGEGATSWRLTQSGLLNESDRNREDERPWNETLPVPRLDAQIYLMFSFL